MFTITRPQGMPTEEFIDAMRDLRIALLVTAAYIAGLCVAVLLSNA